MYDNPLAAESAAAAVDARALVAAWSRGARLLLGYEPDEVIGRPASELLAARLPDSAWRSLAQQVPWTGRVALRDRDGHRVDADVRAYPLVGADGHVGWFVHAARQETDGADLALQRRLLLYHRPSQLAVETAMRYLPADPQAGVGGDWFDVIPLSGARVALVVGDVVGHGINASATMGQLRSAMRTLADVDLPPDELLTQLDDLILEEIGEGIESAGEVGVTCLYMVYARGSPQMVAGLFERSRRPLCRPYRRVRIMASLGGSVPMISRSCSASARYSATSGAAAPSHA